MRKRLRYSMPFLLLYLAVIQLFITVLQGTKPPELEDRDGEQNKLTITQEETLSNLLPHLDCHKSTGPDKIHPRALTELMEVLTKPWFHHLSAVLVNWRDPIGWGLANVMSIYKMCWKVGSGELLSA